MNQTEKTLDFNCITCCFTTSNKKDYGRHLLTSKHIKKSNGYNKDIPISPIGINDHNVCECGKIYKHNSGLWRHKKKCNNNIEILNPEEMSKNDIMKQILLQNQQLIFDNQEFKSMMLDMASKPSSSTINNINTNNNQFNLNLFLNEKCKNAMNMSDFLDTIQIEQDDFENIGKLGYIQGISNIFIKGLKDLDETVRPMHCNDIKRETLYIKDNDVWDKDENKKSVKHAIAMIAHKNFKYIPIWQDANPSSYDVTTKKNDLYMKIANQVTTAITPDDESGINKIIRNVASNVVIDKETGL
jgi:hypothetical protein